MWTVFKMSDTPPRTRKRPTRTYATKRRPVLDRHVHGGHVEPPEHDLCHALLVGLEVPRSFCYLREVVGDRLWTNAKLEQVPSMCVQTSRCADFMLEQVGQAAHHLE